MSGMMDFVMLGIMVLGGAFIWVNKDNLACTFNPNGCGVNQFPGDCTTNPTAAGCGTDPGSGSTDCGKLCRDKKCTDYKKSCHTGCKYCCGSGPNSPKCSGTPGSQCASLCSQGGGSCVANWNQCTTNCTKCPTAAAFAAIQAAARTTASAYTVGCARYTNPVGVRCSISRTCPNGSVYKSPLILIAGKSPSAVVSEMLAAWKAAHPAGCTTGTGCTKTCSGGYVLNKQACTCNCNPTIKGCSGCLKVTPTSCKCFTVGTGEVGSGSGCNTGYYRCKQSDGRCGCCKNPSTCACVQAGKCANYVPGSANCCSWRGRNGGCGPGQIGVPAGGADCKCITGSSLAQASGLRAQVGSPGPYGDYRFADTGRAAQQVRIAA